MSKYEFDRNIAGVQTLWVVLFDQNPKPQNGRNYEFLIPSPLGQGWIPWIFQPQEALQSLDRIQGKCAEIQQSCAESSESLEDYLKKAQNVSKDLGELGDLMDKFRKIMDDLHRPPQNPGGETPPENPA